MRNPLVQRVFDYYSQCGSLCALYELEIRLIAGRRSALERFAYQRLSELEAPFLEHFSSHLSDDEKVLLSKAKKVRDKLLHADFKGLIDKVKEVSPGAIKGPPVGVVKLSGGEVKTVPETSKREGGVYGWFLQSAQDGSLLEAGKILKRAYEIVDKLADEAVNE